MHQVCRDLIYGFRDQGYCDVVNDFARKYPITIFGELYGLPEDRRQEFRELAETWLHDESKRDQAWSAIRGIIRDELESRLVSPTEDMLNGVAHSQVDGEPFHMDVAVNLASTVFLGGLDTLPSNIAWTLRYLADHPKHRRELVEDPSVVPAAVEEFFRVFPSVARNGATATRDIHFHGVDIKAGDRVAVRSDLGSPQDNRGVRPSHRIGLRSDSQPPLRLLGRLAPLFGLPSRSSRVGSVPVRVARGHPRLPGFTRSEDHLHRWCRLRPAQPAFGVGHLKGRDQP